MSVLTLSLLIFAAIYIYIDGIPAISYWVVDQLPVSIDRDVGREARKEILQMGSTDAPRTAFLESFYAELGYSSATKVYVVRASQFNAYALPDNSIFVFDRVLKEVQSYPELAALLAHEYTHIEKRHGMKTLAHHLSRKLLEEVLLGGNHTETFIHSADQLLLLRNSRAFEMEADRGAVGLLVRKGIDPKGMIGLLNRMRKIQDASGSEGPTCLSTHPDTADRLVVVEKEMQQLQGDFGHDEKLAELFEHLRISQ